MNDNKVDLVARDDIIIEEFISLVSVQKASHKEAIKALLERHSLWLSRPMALKITSGARNMYPEAINSLRGAKTADVNRRLDSIEKRLDIHDKQIRQEAATRIERPRLTGLSNA